MSDIKINDIVYSGVDTILVPKVDGGNAKFTEGERPVLITKEITENGTYNASDDNADGFDSVVVNVAGSGGSSGSGGIGTGDYYLKVIDYDGTILDEKRLNTGDTYTLPNAPSHDRLVFQEWSCSQEIVDGVITIADNNVMVGATYTTASGLSEFDITLTKFTGLDVTLKMNGTKNWGDGTSDDSTTHTYTEYGDYTITCDGTTMTATFQSAFFGQSSSAKNYYCTSVRFGSKVTSVYHYVFMYCKSLKSVTIPKGVTSLGQESFSNCSALKAIVIPKSVTEIKPYVLRYCYSLDSVVIPHNIGYGMGSNVFEYCYSLKNVSIPKTMYAVSNYLFQNCFTLKDIIIPQGVNNINQYAFSYCRSLPQVVIPQSVTSIGTASFWDCDSLFKFDFTRSTAIPTLSSSSLFSSKQIEKIYVPDNLYDDWIVATNWATLADYIYKASEMED